MTIPRSPRSLRRSGNSSIADVARWYALQWEKDLLPDEAALAAAALKIIHKTRRIDAKVKREIEAMAAQRAGEDAGAQVDGLPQQDAWKETCPSGGPLRRSTGYAQKQDTP